MSKLTAISPVDGRYQKQTAALSAYFSEFGLIKYRVLVEVHYFLFLADKKFFKGGRQSSTCDQQVLGYDIIHQDGVLM